MPMFTPHASRKLKVFATSYKPTMSPADTNRSTNILNFAISRAHQYVSGSLELFSVQLYLSEVSGGTTTAAGALEDGS